MVHTGSLAEAPSGKKMEVVVNKQSKINKAITLLALATMSTACGVDGHAERKRLTKQLLETTKDYLPWKGRENFSSTGASVVVLPKWLKTSSHS